MTRTECREWCVIRVDPAEVAAVRRSLDAMGILSITPVAEANCEHQTPVLNDALFVEYTEDLLPRIEALEGVVAAVLSNAGRVQDIPQSVVDALVMPDGAGTGDAALPQLKSRLLALSEYYRLDALLAEVARLRANETRDGADA